jgi:hypothetical protein
MLPGNFPSLPRRTLMQKLFRPYLSLPEVEHLCSLLSQNLSIPEAKTAYGKLFKLKLEAEIGLRAEAYQKKPSLLQKLEDQATPKETILPSQNLWETFNSSPSSLSVLHKSKQQKPGDGKKVLCLLWKLPSLKRKWVFNHVQYQNSHLSSSCHPLVE